MNIIIPLIAVGRIITDPEMLGKKGGTWAKCVCLSRIAIAIIAVLGPALVAGVCFSLAVVSVVFIIPSLPPTVLLGIGFLHAGCSCTILMIACLTVPEAIEHAKLFG